MPMIEKMKVGCDVLVLFIFVPVNQEPDFLKNRMTNLRS